MKHEHIALQQAVNDQAEFLTFLRQKSRSEGYRSRKRRIEQGPHPTEELLHDYVWGALDRKASRVIRTHAAFCSGCMRQLRRLAQIRDESEEQFLSWANTPKVEASLPEHAEKALSPDLLDNLAIEFWEPIGAGEALVAASSSVMQEHEFHTKAGTVKVLCAWGQAVGDEPAFLWLSWNAELQDEQTFLIHLIDPELRTIRYEIDPKGIRQGNQTFTQDVLSFDPVGQKWAIAIVIPEREG